MPQLKTTELAGWLDGLQREVRADILRWMLASVPPFWLQVSCLWMRREIEGNQEMTTLKQPHDFYLFRFYFIKLKYIGAVQRAELFMQIYVNSISYH